VGRVSRRAADEIKRTIQIVKGLAPGGSGFAPVGPLFHVAKTTVSHDSEATEDVDIYVGTTKGDEIASGQTVKAYNRGPGIDEDEWVHIQWVGDGWEILSRVAASLTVIGPCGGYVPEAADPDTDFETSYPDGCEGPDVLGLYLKNLDTGVSVVHRLTLASTGPLTLTSDSLSLTCSTGSISCYAHVVFNSLSIGGVIGSLKRVSDDSVVQAYQNATYSYVPMLGGNLQMGPNATACVCPALPYNLCLAIPNR
jgi:hypothetical protein